MTQFIESLKRLYESEKITSVVLNNLLKEDKISNKELDYILGKEE